MAKRCTVTGLRTSPEINRFAVMAYIRFPLSLGNVEDFSHKFSIAVSHDSVRF